MIFFTGDIHGNINRFRDYMFSEQKYLTRNDYMIICGDFGLVWDYLGENENEELKLDELNNKSYTTLFVDGNHECFDRLNNDYEVEMWHGGKVHKIRENVIHLMRGQVYEIDGKTIFTFGGARSHDISDGILNPDDFKTDKEFMDKFCKWNNEGKMFRVNHISWWKEEQPSEEEINEAIKNLSKHNNKVDYIITHDTSTRVLTAMYNFPNHISPINDFFRSLEININYKHWYFGHHHKDVDIDEKTTLLYHSIIPDRDYYIKNDKLIEVNEKQSKEMSEYEI